MKATNLQPHYNTSEVSTSFIFPNTDTELVGQEITDDIAHDKVINFTTLKEPNTVDGISQTNESVSEKINNAEFCEYPVRSLIFILKKLRLKELFKEHVRDPRRRIGKYGVESLLTVGLFHFLFRSESKNDFYQNRYQGRSYRSLSRLAEINQENFPVVKTLDDLFMILNPNDLEPLLFHPGVWTNLLRISA